ncbi:MAG: ATP-binding cassette domain-containing protein [Candidatus Dormibacteraeota bacterium]|nr:ATP-binding cassette domain-containing protein [Candidatus Dormibacteraeota bacterium]
MATLMSRLLGDRTIALRRGTVAVAAVAALTAPLWGDSYTVYLLTQAFLYAALAISLDLVWGYTGILDLGHAVWFGVGALTVGVMTTRLDATGMVSSVHGGLGTYALAGVLAILIAAGGAAVVGLYCFSWRGATMFYVAIVTLAVSVVCEALYLQLHWTGGDNGLFGFRLNALTPLPWFYVCMGFFALVAVFGYFIVRSDFGLLMRAIRDNEDRVRYLGFRVEPIKIGVLAGGAALAAATGAMYGSLLGLVSSPLFGFLFSTQIVIWVAIGGRGTLFGPAIGAIVLQFVSSSLNSSFPDQWQLLVGLAFIAVVVFVPDGIVPPAWRLLDRLVTRGSVHLSGRRLVPFGPPTTASGEEAVAVVNGLEFAYGALRVLRGVSLEVSRGELLCVIGPNGAGKSTLMAVMSDGRMPHQGTVTYSVDGVAGHRGRSVSALARGGVVRKFQTPSLFRGLTVAETILLASGRGRLPSLLHRTAAIAVPEPVLRLCEATGLDRHLEDRGTDLSHGLKQALELAATIAAWPDVLLLDEPTAGLTGHERSVIGGVLRTLVDEHRRTVVLIEHDLDFVDELADRIAVLQDGRVLAVGSTSEIKDDTSVREGYLGVTGATA